MGLKKILGFANQKVLGFTNENVLELEISWGFLILGFPNCAPIKEHGLPQNVPPQDALSLRRHPVSELQECLKVVKNIGGLNL